MTQPFYYDPADPPGKQRILTAALHLFSQHGLEGTSIRDIADRAGLSNPALYKHYKTKEALALDLFQLCYRHLFAALSRALSADAPFESKLTTFLTVYAEFYDHYPDAVIFTNDALPTLWPKVATEMKRRTALSLLRDMLDQGRQSGAVANHDIDLQMTLVSGSVSQLLRQLRFNTLPGPAIRHVPALSAMLRAALA